MRLASSLTFGLASLASASLVTNRMSGIHLTIVTTEDPPFIKVRDNGTAAIKPWQNWTGWIPALIKETSEMANFTYTLQLSSSKATTAYGASDTEVIQTRTRTSETTQNFAGTEQGGFGTGPPDVHWAGAYITDERLKDLEMTAPFATTPLSLLVRIQSPDFTKKIFTIIEPFDISVWAVILALTVGGGLWSLLLQSNTTVTNASNVIQLANLDPEAKDSFIQQVVNLMNTKGKKKKSVSAEKVEKVTIHENVKFSMFSAANLAQAVYISFQRQLWSTGDIKHGYLLKVFSMFWGAWIVIWTTAYTGNLAAYLSTQHYVLEPRLFTDFVKEPEKYKACVLEGSAYANFLATHTTYKNIKQVPVSNLEDMGKKLFNDECHGIIERQMHVEYLQARNSSSLVVSDILKDGPQKLSVMVKPDVFNTSFDTTVTSKLSYWLTKMHSSGAIAELYKYEVLRASGAMKRKRQTQNRFCVLDILGVIVIFTAAAIPMLLFRILRFLWVFSTSQKSGEQKTFRDEVKTTGVALVLLLLAVVGLFFLWVSRVEEHNRKSFKELGLDSSICLS